jgi:cysteine desulfurase/selenocysteine lyase
VHVSNTLGTINPVEEIVRLAHEHGAIVLIDGAQALAHVRINVRDLGCDFYAGSAHKAFGPTGIGFLYGRFDLLDSLPPWQGGGDMIRSVSFEKTTYNDLPNRFEAGTPNIAGAIGFGAAIKFLESLDMDAITRHESDLLAYGTQLLEDIDGVRIIGQAKHKASVLSFVIDGIHPHDIGTLVDQYGVAIRTGHHCTQPLMERFGIPATARASMAMYNSRDDLDALAGALRKVIEVFG